MSETLPHLSVVVPVASRADDLADIYSAFSKAVAAAVPGYEFVFVFDGSAATPNESFLKLAQHDSRIRVYQLSHTFGETGALRAGIAESRGEIILTLPAYFQVLPAAVSPLLAALTADVDIVVTKREPRHDPWLNRLQTRVFHTLVKWVTGTEFGDIACGVRALRRPTAELLPLYGDLHRFLPAFARQQGLHVVEIALEQHPKDSRTRVYRPGTYVRRILDVFTVLFLLKFTEKPLRFFGLVALWFFGAGVAITSVLAVQRLAGVGIANRPLLLLGVLLIALAVQIAGLGLVGEIVVHWQAGDRGLYRIKRPHGNASATPPPAAQSTTPKAQSQPRH